MELLRFIGNPLELAGIRWTPLELDKTRRDSPQFIGTAVIRWEPINIHSASRLGEFEKKFTKASNLRKFAIEYFLLYGAN